MKIYDVTPEKYFITGHHHNDHLCDFLGDCADSGKTCWKELGKVVNGRVEGDCRFVGWSEETVNAAIELAFKKYKDVRETYQLVRLGTHIKIVEISTEAQCIDCHKLFPSRCTCEWASLENLKKIAKKCRCDITKKRFVPARKERLVEVVRAAQSRYGCSI